MQIVYLPWYVCVISVVSKMCDMCLRSGNGVISTVAGTGSSGFQGDGGLATSAGLYYPCGVAIDASGNIYIADFANHRIRMFSLYVRDTAFPSPSSIVTAVPTYSLAPYSIVTAVPTYSLAPSSIVTAVPTYSLAPYSIVTAVPTYSLAPSSIVTSRPSMISSGTVRLS